MAAHTHTVVWIDHREARIFHFNAVDAEKVLLRVDHPTHLHHKANTIGSGHAAEDQHFYERVTASIADAALVLITGPANAKTELVKHIERHSPQLRAKIAGIETVDHPTEGQLLDHARRFFTADHLAPRRMSH